MGRRGIPYLALAVVVVGMAVMVVGQVRESDRFPGQCAAAGGTLVVHSDGSASCIIPAGRR